MAKIVVALGGNALQRKGKASAADQKAVAQQFVDHSGHSAVIGELNELEAIMAGQAGTTITP